MTTFDETKARRTLARRDRVLAALIRPHGTRSMRRPPADTELLALARAIIFQQLSTKAASTIYSRFLALFPQNGPPGADAILAVHPRRLRGVGLSRAKALYVRDLCRRVAGGAVPLDCLADMDDEAVIDALTSIKGIGRWSAEMFLMFQLGRPDVFPVGDLGIARAIQRAYGLRARPSASRLRAIAEAWRPYRSVACLYLWASLRNTPA